jgi:hypothetical protein
MEIWFWKINKLQECPYLLSSKTVFFLEDIPDPLDYKIIITILQISEQEQG